MKINEIITEAKAITQRLDAKCWKGKHKEGTKIKGGVRVNNCVPNESIEEEWSKKYKDSINCSDPKGFSQKAHCAGKNEDIEVAEGHGRYYCSTDKKWKTRKGPKQTRASESLDESLDKQFDIIEEMVNSLAEEHGVDADVIWEDFESVDDNELYETAAWRRKAGKNKNGGLNAKGVASYRRENPGSKLQTAVTTKPSKLKKGSKAAKRRKSFCARMSGVKGPMKKPNGKPTRKALALRKWNC